MNILTLRVHPLFNYQRYTKYKLNESLILSTTSSVNNNVILKEKKNNKKKILKQNQEIYKYKYMYYVRLHM